MDTKATGSARWIMQIVVAAVAYLATAKLGFLLALEHTNATALWPPAGIALAACLLPENAELTFKPLTPTDLAHKVREMLDVQE